MKYRIVIILLFTLNISYGQYVRWEYSGNGNNVDKKDPENEQTPKSKFVDEQIQKKRNVEKKAKAAWSDKTGKIWMLGAIGIGDSVEKSNTNELWNFDTDRREWKKLYENKISEKEKLSNMEKLELSVETPMEREKAAIWSDLQGNLYIYGGLAGANDNLDDFWRFNIENSKWEKIKKSDRFNNIKSVAGKNKEAKTNSPGARSGAMTWTDNDGNLWLFGGCSFDTKLRKVVYYNDLWKYDLKKSGWIWLSGNLEPDAKTKEMNSTEITPTPRIGSATWFDGVGKKLWLYGGFGLSISANIYGSLGDMWYFDLNKGLWVGEREIDGFFIKPIYESNTEKGMLVSPGSRHFPLTWTDNEGKFWLYGGQVEMTQSKLKVERNLWTFNPLTKSWSSVFSETPPPIYTGGSTLVDKNNTFWLFGGEYLDDKLNLRSTNKIWKFTVNISKNEK